MTGSQSLKFQIYEPAGLCLLFEETQTITLNSDGTFSVKVGSGTRASAGVDGGLIWRNIFQNDAMLRASSSANCTPGYTPASNDGRKLRVTVNGVTLSPDHTLSAVPMATVAESLQGKVPADFLPSSGNISVNGPMKLNAQNELRLGDASTNYVALKAPVSVGTNVTWTLPGSDGTVGQVLSTNGSGTLQWTTAGGGGISTLNGLSVGAQNFSIAQSGLSPAWTSAGGTHTLNLPLASTTSATGLITNAEFTNFTNKLNKSGDVMTGALTLPSDPASPLHAATKQYVDNNFLRTNGSTTLTGNLNVGNFRITNLAAPTMGTDAVSKAYSDSTYLSSAGPINMSNNLTVNGTATFTGAVTLAGMLNSSNQIATSALGNPSAPSIALGAGLGFFSSSSALAIATSSTERLRISSSGNLGIGTATPISPVQIANTVPPQTQFALLSIGNPADFSGQFNGDPQGTVLGVSMPGGFGGSFLNFTSGGVERLRVDADGLTTINAALQIGIVGTPILSVQRHPSLNPGSFTPTSAPSGGYAVGVVSTPSAAVGDIVECAPTTAPANNMMHSCFVSASGLVKIVVYSASGAALTPPSNWNVTITKF